MNQILRCDWLPEWARWSYLACLGLPIVSRKKNFPKSHIINPLLTKLVQSRWLDIGLVLFCEFMDRDSLWVHEHAKKNLANIRPSWPHIWSITHMYCPITQHNNPWGVKPKPPYPGSQGCWLPINQTKRNAITKKFNMRKERNITNL